MKPLRIALVSDWYLPRVGGLETQMRGLALQLTAVGHHVEIVCANPGPDEIDGLTIHRMSSPLPRIETVWNYNATCAALAHIFSTRRYDLVHGHSAFSPLSLLGMYVARRLGIASLLTEHSVLRGFSGNILRTVNRFFQWTQHADAFAAVSSYVARELGEMSGREVAVLPNGILVEEFDRPNDDSAGPMVLAVMRLMRRKRPCDLVRAIPRVLAALPPGTPAPRFVVAGDGPMRSKVEREVARLGVTRHLELRGWMSRDQVKELLSQATVFALPSSWEALSIATLEALAAGVPAVAMSGCGVTDIIQPGREGLLGGNLDEFAACLARLISDRALRDQLAGRARAAAGRFAWSTVLQRHLEVYERVLARRRVEPSTFRPPVAA